MPPLICLRLGAFEASRRMQVGRVLEEWHGGAAYARRGGSDSHRHLEREHLQGYRDPSGRVDEEGRSYQKRCPLQMGLKHLFWLCVAS